MNYETGSLVSYRGRDWIVLPPLHDNALLLKPLGGTDAEIVEMSPELEQISSSAFALPDPADAGDARSCALLRNAVRLGLRATTGPFRCFGHIAVEPRPYQLVPLLMAMKQKVVRLLIAERVGENEALRRNRSCKREAVGLDLPKNARSEIRNILCRIA